MRYEHRFTKFPLKLLFLTLLGLKYKFQIHHYNSSKMFYHHTKFEVDQSNGFRITWNWHYLNYSNYLKLTASSQSPYSYTGKEARGHSKKKVDKKKINEIRIISMWTSVKVYSSFLAETVRNSLFFNTRICHRSTFSKFLQGPPWHLHFKSVGICVCGCVSISYSLSCQGGQLQNDLFLHLHKIVEGLYFHCSLSVCVSVCVSGCPALLVNK